MSALFGAIAYRLSVLDKFQEVINVDGMEQCTETVQCPKCEALYSLIEQTDVDAETLQEDIAFLEKALGTAHPCHPDCLIVRDPGGAMNRHYRQTEAGVGAQRLIVVGSE